MFLGYEKLRMLQSPPDLILALTYTSKLSPPTHCTFFPRIFLQTEYLAPPFYLPKSSTFLNAHFIT